MSDKKIVGEIVCGCCGEALLIREKDINKPPKRKPDANGVLPLTDKELKEFGKLAGEDTGVVKVIFCYDGIEYYVGGDDMFFNEREVS